MAALTCGPPFRGPKPEATTVHEYAARLHAAGWSVGETCFRTNCGPVWQVDGTNGENQLPARAPTRTAAWRQAVKQAAATGML
jgi:hypothetical protein